MNTLTENGFIGPCQRDVPVKAPVPLGHDNAADIRANYTAFLPHIDLGKAANRSELKVSSSTDEDEDDNDEYVQMHMPTEADGLATHAYTLALRNRIKIGKIKSHGDWSMSAYKPIFIYDCLMQPGSLATLLNKMPPDIIPRMTPAFLAGYYPYVHTETQQPCVMQSVVKEDCVQGMLIFGEGKQGRRILHDFYRETFTKVTVEVEADITVPVYEDREHENEQWCLQRRKIKAVTWVWSNVTSGDAHFRHMAPKWKLEDYLEGKLDQNRTMRIESRPWIEEMVNAPGGDDWEEGQVEASGGGSVDLGDARESVFAGW